MNESLHPAEYVVAGHSHIFAMGASVGYRGEVSLLRSPISNERRTVYFLMAEWRGNRESDYWSRLADEAPGRIILISFNGNQHYGEFLFEADEPFDFFDPDLPSLPNTTDWPLVPRRLIKAHFERSLHALEGIVASLRTAGAARVVLLGTPAPKADSRRFLDAIRGSDHWKLVAARRGISLDNPRLTPEWILLKMWRLLQELMQETATRAGAQFMPIPAEVRDAAGFLAERFIRPGDLTHANEDYGRLVLDLATSDLSRVA